MTEIRFPLFHFQHDKKIHLKASKVCGQVVLLEGGGVEGDGVGQVDLTRLDLRHHVHQVQNLVRPFKKVGSNNWSFLMVDHLHGI